MGSVVRVARATLASTSVPPEHTVDWALQIDVEGHAPAQRAKRIDSDYLPRWSRGPPRSPDQRRAPTMRR
jgi:hypothetical protein